jgi:hypothetical protein
MGTSIRQDRKSMLYRGVPQMQPIGKRLTREQHQVLKELRTENGFEEMNTKAFLSLLRLLHHGGRGGRANIRSDGFNYSIQRINL